MSTTPATGPADETRALRDEVVALAHSLPSGLRRLTVRDGERAIEVEWAAEVPVTTVTVPAGTTTARDLPVAVADAAADAAEGTVTVRSPLVGTFYAAPSPGADPFVRVGDEVEPGQTVGIVEAMKLMNPIVADEAGVVAEVLVGDAESVEYDQVLLRLRPTGRAR
ncbi:acetyl-CoA carboxylase biotin carboxyl carrier protein [Geodermatophilus sp. DSM 44513]|uniref:acetyl-CoA carboxylase biotin carboxyl carrier protein n=1 Tax=Geodermatophilus sp. DSM 44513 TaxID=1528104 RepID=UPI0028F73EB4|nr:acetyl-CoA carboxylase biotin carboxyl carrier protein [Geodermatophilus sp. DSM 44513]WNV75810.1 acetyl-CoA carboxylase biotin carboxyl carrier protein [Geodermatophilus sp. DSM 44513]